MTAAEAIAAYDCIKGDLKAGYANSGYPVANVYQSWASFNSQPYVSGTHGERYVNNYANGFANRSYGDYENVGVMPESAVLAKDSFLVNPNGEVVPGPLFVMEKMYETFYAESNDWRYTLIMPNGNVFGKTKGAGFENVQYCIDCHMPLGEDTDSLLFMPDEFRK